MMEAAVNGQASSMAGNLGAAVNFRHERGALEVHLRGSAAIPVVHRVSSALHYFYPEDVWLVLPLYLGVIGIRGLSLRRGSVVWVLRCSRAVWVLSCSGASSALQRIGSSWRRACASGLR